MASSSTHEGGGQAGLAPRAGGLRAGQGLLCCRAVTGSAPTCLFLRRPFPSANVVLLPGPRPILVDTGSGTDWDEIEAWLQAQGVPPHRLALVVNTHHHSDHVGGNHAVQSRHGVPVAAHAVEADAINRRQADACDSVWLRQAVAPYLVQHALQAGEVLDTGRARWRVIHTPGHTAGHVSLFAAQTGELVVGDVVHADDVAWMAPCHAGADTADRLLDSIERLEGLQPRIAWSGHGPPLTDPAAACAAARQRLLRWRDDPARAGWHACKRIFAHGLILAGGVPEAHLGAWLLGCPWFCDHARLVFGQEPAAFVGPLVEEMLRAGAAHWRANRLVAAAATGSGAAGT